MTLNQRTIELTGVKMKIGDAEFEEIVKKYESIGLTRKDAENKLRELKSETPLEIQNDAPALRESPKLPDLEHIKYKIVKMKLVNPLNPYGWYSKINNITYVDISVPEQFIPYTAVHEHRHSEQPEDMGYIESEMDATIFATVYCMKHRFSVPWKWIRNVAGEHYKQFLIELEKKLYTSSN